MASVTSPPVPPRTNANHPPQSRQSSSLAGGKLTSDAIISQRIATAQAALWRAELSRGLLIPVVSSLIALTAWAAIDQWIWSPGKMVRLLALIGGFGAIVLWIRHRVWPLLSHEIHPDYAAYSLEHDLPELRHSLTSYVSLSQDHAREGVRGVVVRSIGVRAADQLQHHEIDVPSEASANLGWWLGVAGAIAVTLGFAALSPKSTVQSTKRLLLPLASIDAPSRVNILDVLPGDTEVLAGRPFEILAGIVGLSKTESARVEFSTGFASSKSLELQLDSGKYTTSISVDSATSYRIVAGDATAGPFQITTKDVPVVSIHQVEVSPPAYTRLPIRSTTGGAIVGEENSIVKITAKTNRPVARARIEFNPRAIGDKLQPSAGTMDLVVTGDGVDLEASFPLRRSLRQASNGSNSVVAVEAYLLHVWDSAGCENLEPIVYPVRIVADMEPEIAFTEPQKPMTEVPVNGAQKIEVQSLDPDYGLKQIEIQLRRGVDILKRETLWSSTDGERGNQTSMWVFQPKSLGLRVGETIQVIAIASDNRHDENGRLKSNVVASDPISLMVTKPQENAKLPDFEKPKEQPAGQAKDDAPSEGGGESSDNNQGGQGGSSKDQSGKSKQGEGQTDGGSPGKGKSEQGEGAEQEQSPSGGGTAEEGKPDSDQSASSSDPTGKGSSGGSDQTGASAGKQDPATEPTDSGPEGSASTDNQSEQQGQPASGGQSGQKPAHDGDAFERIRDFIDESKKNDQGHGGTGDGLKADNQADGRDEQPAEKPSHKTETAETRQPQKPGSSSAGNSNSSDKMKDGSTGDSSDTSDENEKGKNQPSQGQQKNAGADSGAMKSSESDATGKQQGQGANGNSNSTEEASSEEAGTKATGSEETGQTTSGKPANEASEGQSPTESPSPSKDTAPGEETGGQADQGQSSETQREKSGKSGQGQAGNEPRKTGQPNPNHNKEESGKPDVGSGTPSGPVDDNAPNKEAQSPSSAAAGGGSGDSIATDSPEDIRPPDPIDVDQARQATDLVLDYLNLQREKPDPELLERLDWTPDELRAFADRWNKIRGLDQKTQADTKQIEEALRSLGIRSKQNGQVGRASETDDSLRGLKDSGNRTPAPSIHRDAFDAFRKNVNRK